MDSATRACGGCHGDKVGAVSHSPMSTGSGRVALTRQVFGEPVDRPGHNDLSQLEHPRQTAPMRHRLLNLFRHEIRLLY